MIGYIIGVLVFTTIFVLAFVNLRQSKPTSNPKPGQANEPSAESLSYFKIWQVQGENKSSVVLDYCAGASQTLNITSNNSWEIKYMSSNISVNPQFDAAGTSTVTISTTNHNQTGSRISLGTVRFSPASGDPVDLYVYQDSEPSGLSIVPSGVGDNPPYYLTRGETATFTAMANNEAVSVTWSISDTTKVENVSWTDTGSTLTVRGTANGGVTITANHSNYALATINFTVIGEPISDDDEPSMG